MSARMFGVWHASCMVLLVLLSVVSTHADYMPPTGPSVGQSHAACLLLARSPPLLAIGMDREWLSRAWREMQI